MKSAKQIIEAEEEEEEILRGLLAPQEQWFDFKHLDGTVMRRVKARSFRHALEWCARYRGTMSHNSLRYIDLRARNLDGYNLRGGDFENGDFRGASLRGTDFAGTTLYRARFNGADLEKANFWKADCRYCHFINANLSEASFLGADASHAVFSGAVQFNTEYTDADIHGAIGIEYPTERRPWTRMPGY